MDYHYIKDKINNIFKHYIDAPRPTFFDVNKICPNLANITKANEQIVCEFNNVLLNIKDLPRYHDVDPGESAISDTTKGRWNVFMLYLLGYQTDRARDLCPELCKLLKTIPNLIQAFFSVLEPQKSIPKHCGPYLGYLRYHLGVKIPKDNPPQIIVNDIAYTWKEGEHVLFDDSWPHEVVNNSNEERVVLIIDILRPMPLLPHTINKLATWVAKHTYGRKTMLRAKKYGELAKPIAQ